MTIHSHSVYPLMRESLGVLMQRTPVSLDHTLQACLQKVSPLVVSGTIVFVHVQRLAPDLAPLLPSPSQVYELEGVVQLQDVHVWTLCSGVYHGSLRVEVLAGTDHRRLLMAARSILTQVYTSSVWEPALA